MSIRTGAARTDITPAGPVWMAGYGDRDRRSEGVYQPLTAGAVYIGGADDVAVVIAADLIGFDLAYAAQAKQRIAAAAGMLPRQVVLTATHTHCGPLFYPMMMPGEPELEYAERLCEKLAALAVAARAGAVPGRVSFSRTRSGFGVNRRLPRRGKAVFAPNPDGPADRDLDTLWFESEAGELLANLTVYGCHATSMGGYQIGGDYPGFLCAGLRDRTGAPAFFSAGCAGDVRPWYNPGGAGFRRPGIDEVAAAGEGLAGEVLAGQASSQPVDAGGLKIAGEFHLLPYAGLPDGEYLDRFAAREEGQRRRWAEYVKGLLERGPLPGGCAHEVQVLQLNPGFRVLFLGGEVLSEIGLHLKRALSPAVTVAAAYSNGLIGYIPSKNACPLGGYEVDGSHYYFRLPAPFTGDVEDRVVETALRVVESMR